MAKVTDSVDQVLAEMPATNIRRKLSNLRLLIPNIEKTGTAPEKMGGYSFMKAEEVCGVIGDKMAVMGLSMVPTNVNIVSHQIVDGRASHVVLTVTYRFIDADSDEFIEVGSAGEGKDFGDKAVPKALTGAKKYALTQALTMRVGDDAEADDLSKHQEHRPEPKNVSAPVQPQRAGNPVGPNGGGGPLAPARERTGPVITQKQRNRMFAIAKGDTELIKRVQKSPPWLYDRSDHIIMGDYDAICKEIERQRDNPDGNVAPIDDENIPF